MMMKGSHGQANQLHDIIWCALDHAFHAPQLRPCNCNVLCVCVCTRVCIHVHTYMNISIILTHRRPLTLYLTYSLSFIRFSCYVVGIDTELYCILFLAPLQEHLRIGGALILNIDTLLIFNILTNTISFDVVKLPTTTSGYLYRSI